MSGNHSIPTPQQGLQQQQQRRRRQLWRQANTCFPILCLMLLMLQLASATKPKIAVDPTGEEENELNTVGQLTTNGVQTGVVANPQHITSATMNQGKNAKTLVTTSSSPSLASTTTSTSSGGAAAGTLGKASTNSAAPLVQQQAPALQGTFTGVSSGGGNTPAVPATPLVATQPAMPAASAGSSHSLGGYFKAVSGGGAGRRLKGVAAIQD